MKTKEDPPIFISEQLTAKRARFYYLARQVMGVSGTKMRTRNAAALRVHIFAAPVSQPVQRVCNVFTAVVFRPPITLRPSGCTVVI